jgi:hypothetical protein
MISVLRWGEERISIFLSFRGDVSETVGTDTRDAIDGCEHVMYTQLSFI